MSDKSKQQKTAPISAPVTQEEPEVELLETEETETPAVATTPVKVKAFTADNDAIVAARHELSALLGPTAKLRNDAAKLNAAANDTYKAVSPLTVAHLYATIATEVFAMYPALRTAVRSWASAWKYQMEMLALETFGATEGDKAVDLRTRFGSDASKYGLTFYYCPNVLAPWVGKLYGTQPEQYPTLAQAYAIARSLKLAASPKKDEQLVKLWGATVKKFATVAEMRRFVNIVERDVAAREQQSKETPAPQTPVIEHAPALAQAVNQ